MSDKEPLLCRVSLGLFRPVTGAAEEAAQALGEGTIVRIEVVKARGNTKRLGLYWVCLKKACELLSDAVDGILSRQALHRWLKRDQGLAKPIVSKKTGEVIDYDYESIGFQKMPEHERAEYITAALERISKRLGCDVTELRQSVEAETGLRWSEPGQNRRAA
jgi:hypothetical protein